MHPIIKDKQKELQLLCKKFHVKQLEAFGSVTTNKFNPETSDIDFLVEFTQEGITDYANCFFGLQEALQTLFSRPIELVVTSSIKNPYFLESIEKDRTFLYAA